MPDLTLAANNGAIGGGEVMLLLMAKLARELGLEVAIVAPDDSAVARRADELGFPTTGIRGRNRNEYIPNLRRWDRRERSGLLWCHGLVPALATTGHPHRVVQLHQRPPVVDGRCRGTRRRCRQREGRGSLRVHAFPAARNGRVAQLDRSARCHRSPP